MSNIMYVKLIKIYIDKADAAAPYKLHTYNFNLKILNVYRKRIVCQIGLTSLIPEMFIHNFFIFS